MPTRILVLLMLLLSPQLTHAQSIMGDVFSGKLLNPEVGVYSWYDLTDSTSGKQFYLRLAIVGEEKVKGKDGFWLEIELLPRVGFPAVYKMLVTGPASDPKNVHRIIMKEGSEDPVEIDSNSLSAGAEAGAGAKRTVVGEDEVMTQIGTVISEHVVVEQDGVSTDIWLNDEVRPMGLVKIKNAQGEMVLRNYGIGGDQSLSAMDKPVLPTAPGQEPSNEAPVVDAPPSSAIVNLDTSILDDAGSSPEPQEPDTESEMQDAAVTEVQEADAPNSLGNNTADKEELGNEEAEEEDKKQKSRRAIRGVGGRPR